jgi:3-dehydrosphinganine reductase
MKNNYYACVYPAKILLNLWIDDDKKGALSKTTPPNAGPKPRKIIFINSAAAFLGFPGSGAYTRKPTFRFVSVCSCSNNISIIAAKMAVRGLADTLRLEVLRHNCPLSTYTIHSAYPADFVSPGFVLEQNTKTPLTKRIQGLSGQTLDELKAKYPSSEKVAGLVIAAVDRGDFVICDGFPISSLLFTNMVGLTPKRGWGILDSMLGVLTGWFIIPYFRRKWEAETKRDRA